MRGGKRLAASVPAGFLRRRLTSLERRRTQGELEKAPGWELTECEGTRSPDRIRWQAAMIAAAPFDEALVIDTGVEPPGRTRA